MLGDRHMIRESKTRRKQMVSAWTRKKPCFSNLTLFDGQHSSDFFLWVLRRANQMVIVKAWCL